MDRERELANTVLKLAQDLANYRRMADTDGRNIDPDEALITYNMSLVHCEHALRLLKRLGLNSV